MDKDSGFITNFSKEEVYQILIDIKRKVQREDYTVSMNRPKNRDFMRNYQISTEEIKQILLELAVEDFGYALLNNRTDPRYSDEILHVFCKTCHFIPFTEEDYVAVEVFIKLNNLVGKCIIVSFHKAERSFNFLFK